MISANGALVVMPALLTRISNPPRNPIDSSARRPTSSIWLKSARNAAAVLLGRGVRAAVVKLGAQGAVYASAVERGYQPPYTVAAVDSVAAGDAFNGALAVCLAEGTSLAVAVKTAAAAGALAVTTTGAQNSMPSRMDVEALVTSQPS